MCSGADGLNGSRSDAFTEELQDANGRLRIEHSLIMADFADKRNYKNSM
jgi:hypothetical protein